MHEEECVSSSSNIKAAAPLPSRESCLFPVMEIFCIRAEKNLLRVVGAAKVFHAYHFCGETKKYVRCASTPALFTSTSSKKKNAQAPTHHSYPATGTNHAVLGTTSDTAEILLRRRQRPRACASGTTTAGAAAARGSCSGVQRRSLSKSSNAIVWWGY